ncbi:energy transducer TonB [Hymenobacter sp. 5317J-9]|uniref:TonB family protein n=1 Tax=Hymenobacter sp. 5317J-9 TaxID=2932250 RepID=UPI001FD7167C|nr:TonB family protein [Hymenobacter sp. 5317J-9]UOQ97376.1 energy transducer TonB [Hymenobacter sp. 5317J-9]
MKPRVRYSFSALAAPFFASLLVLLALARPAAAQGEAEEEKVYTYVEQMPQLPGSGGNQAIVAAIQERLVYPEQARRDNVTGRVFVSFTVTTTGGVKSIKVVKGIGAGCDEATIAAVSQLPRFIPGKQNGRAVSVSFTVPATFPPASGATAPALLDGARVYSYVEQMPTLPAPNDKTTLQAAVLKNMVFPAEVRDAKSEGPVQVTFVVDGKGNVRDPKIVTGLCPACDEAVLAAVRKLPRLVPGQQGGQPVAVNMVLPLQLISPNHVYPADPRGLHASFAEPAGLYDYIRRNLRVPAVVASEKLQGRVRVEFVVRPTGKIDAAEVKTHLCTSCDAEALRLVNAFPAWKPARDNADQSVATRQFVDIPMPLPDPNKPFTDTDKVYSYAESMPTLLDGSPVYGPTIQQAVRYPEAVKRENINGTVYAEYVIDADGLVRKPHITRGLCTSCDQAVLDAIAQVCPCTPAQQNGRAIPIQMRVEVPFAPSSVSAAPTPAPTPARKPAGSPAKKK